MDALTIRVKKMYHFLPFIGALVISLLLLAIFPQSFKKIDFYVSDNSWEWLAASSELEQRLVIIDIDEVSIAKHGSWPWPRDKMAELSEKLSNLGVQLQIFDMVFAAEQPTDIKFVAQLKAGNKVVLSEILAINANNKTNVGVLSGGIEGICNENYPKANASIANNKMIMSTSPFLGHITPKIDFDGVVRRLPAFICKDNSAYPALALAALSAGLGEHINYTHEISENWLLTESQLRIPQLPDTFIPLSAEGELVLPWWLAKESLLSISAADILEDKVNVELLKGAWVFIASTAFGGGDSIATPLSNISAGVEVHVQLLSALLNNTLPYQPKGLIFIIVVWILIVSGSLFLSGKIKSHLVIYSGLLLAGVFSLLLIVLQFLLLKFQQIILPISFMLVYTLLSGVAMAIQGYSLSWLENKRLYFNLSSYLSEHAAKWIVKQESVNELAAHHEDVFVMYVDLRNFSNWCNQLPAEEIAAILHAFYKTVHEVVEQHGGQTEKYIGDAVLCIWRENNNTILTAAEQLIELLELQLGEQGVNSDLPPLGVGIGIEYGRVMIASLGPAQRREYTIIGNTVTNAIQLQEMTTELALPILIGAGAAYKWKSLLPLESQGKFLLSGASQVMELFVPENN